MKTPFPNNKEIHLFRKESNQHPSDRKKGRRELERQEEILVDIDIQIEEYRKRYKKGGEDRKKQEERGKEGDKKEKQRVKRLLQRLLNKDDVLLFIFLRQVKYEPITNSCSGTMDTVAYDVLVRGGATGCFWGRYEKH